MTVTYQNKPLKVIVTDIEGTTTDVAFVHKVLFPYAEKYLPHWIPQHLDWPLVHNALQQVREITGQPGLDLEGCLHQLLMWQHEDQKITPLKTLQGLVWKTGYDRGELRAPLYPDVIQHLREWRTAGLTLAVYSSGSIAAQKLLFSHTTAGDLSNYFSGWFDTTTGSKHDASSYQTIARELFSLPEEVLFLSDSPEELDAAAAAGVNVCGLDREFSANLDPRFPLVNSFSDIPLQGV